MIPDLRWIPAVFVWNPSATTRGMKEAEMDMIAEMIDTVIMNYKMKQSLPPWEQVLELTKVSSYPELTYQTKVWIQCRIGNSFD